MRKELSPKEKHVLKLKRYEESLKEIQSQIEDYGKNNHLLNVESYFKTKVFTLKQDLRKY